MIDTGTEHYNITIGSAPSASGLSPIAEFSSPSVIVYSVRIWSRLLADYELLNLPNVLNYSIVTGQASTFSPFFTISGAGSTSDNRQIINHGESIERDFNSEIYDTDTTNDLLTFTYNTPTFGVVTIGSGSSNLSVTYSATSNVHGDTNYGNIDIELILTDETGNQITATWYIYVNYVPIAHDFIIDADEDVGIYFKFNDYTYLTDLDDTDLDIKITQLPTGNVQFFKVGTSEAGSDVVVDSIHTGNTNFYYKSNSNNNDNTSFKFIVIDSKNAESNEATVSIHVASINDLPTWDSFDNTISINENTSPIGVLTVSATDFDSEDNTISIKKILLLWAF